MEELKVIGSALAIIGSLVWAIKFLLKINYKQSTEILKSEKELHAERLENLKILFNEHRKHLDETMQELNDTVRLLEVTRREVAENKNIMVKYVDSTDKKIKAFESQVVQLSKDLIWIKSKTKGHIQ